MLVGKPASQKATEKVYPDLQSVVWHHHRHELGGLHSGHPADKAVAGFVVKDEGISVSLGTPLSAARTTIPLPAAATQTFASFANLNRDFPPLLSPNLRRESQPWPTKTERSLR